MSRVLPILFNTDMVRAILDGRKTVTRRLIKPQPKCRLCYTFAGCNHGTWSYPSDTAHEFWGEEYRLPDCITDDDKQMVWTPPYHTDDILYVRETWNTNPLYDYGNETNKYVYKADYDGHAGEFGWHPSIHMPKEAARIWLKVTDVRVERLQKIDGTEILAEGIDNGKSNRAQGKRWENMQGMAFESLWNSTLKKSDLARYGWGANPWVWVIEFERCEMRGMRRFFRGGWN